MKPKPHGTSEMTLPHLFGGGQVRHVCPFCQRVFTRIYTVDQWSAVLYFLHLRCPHCDKKGTYVKARQAG